MRSSSSARATRGSSGRTWDEAAAEDYGVLRATLEKAGTPLGAMDMMIAAHARSAGLTLVSNDVRHFDRVEGLSVAHWV